MPIKGVLCPLKEQERVVLHRLNLLVIERELRANVCTGCPDRSREVIRSNAARPLACERRCELFQELPALLCEVERLDPLLARYDTAVESMVVQRGPSNCAAASGSKLMRHRRAVGAAFKQSAVG